MTYPFHYDPPAARDFDQEIAVQAAILARLMIGFPTLRVAAVPNGQKRTRWQAMNALAEGMAPGFPDLMIFAPADPMWGQAIRGERRLGAGAAQILGPLTAIIEVKAKESLTKEQADWLTWLDAAGFHCGVFRSQDTLAAKLKEWGFPHRERS